MEICRVIHSNARQLEKASRILVSTVKCGDEDMTARWSKWRVVEKGKEIVEPWVLLTRPQSNSSIYKLCGPKCLLLVHWIPYLLFWRRQIKPSHAKPSITIISTPPLFEAVPLWGFHHFIKKKKREKGKRNEGIKKWIIHHRYLFFSVFLWGTHQTPWDGFKICENSGVVGLVGDDAAHVCKRRLRQG